MFRHPTVNCDAGSHLVRLELIPLGIGKPAGTVLASCEAFVMIKVMLFTKGGPLIALAYNASVAPQLTVTCYPEL